MVTDDNKIKLIDFGFAMQDKSYSDILVGTPRFMSPEVFQKKYSPAVDIWALGVSMFYLFTANFPFDADSMEKLSLQIKKGKFNMPKDISEEGKDLLEKMLNLNPNKSKTKSESFEIKSS